MSSMTDTSMRPLPTIASELLSSLEPLSHCERWQYMLNLGQRCQSSISSPALGSAAAENNNSSSRKSTSNEQADDATAAASLATMRRILYELAASDEYYETLVAVMGLRGMLATITTKEEATTTTTRPTQVALADDVRQACLRLLTQTHPDISTLACSLVAQTASEETLMYLLCENESAPSALNYATYASLVKAVQRSAEGQRVLSEAFRRVMRQTPTTLSQRAVCLACAIPTTQLVWGDKSHGSTATQPHTALTTTATTTTTHDTASAPRRGGREEEEQSVMQPSNATIANEQKEVCTVAWWRCVLPQLSRGALCSLTLAHPEWVTDTLRAALRAERQQYDNDTVTTAVGRPLAEKPSTARSADVREDKEKKEEGATEHDDDEEEDDKASAEVFCVSRALNAAIVAVLQALPRAHMHRSHNTKVHTTTTTRTLSSTAAQEMSEPPQTPCELGLVLLQESLPYLQRTQGNASDDIVLQQLLSRYLRCCPRRVCHAILTRRDLPWPALRLTSTQLRTKLAHETDLLFALVQQGRIEDLPHCYRYLPIALRRRLYTTQRPLLVYAHTRRHRYHDDSDSETNSNSNDDEEKDTQKKKSALSLPLSMSVLRHLPDSSMREAEARAHWVAEMERSAKDSRGSERCAKYLSLLPYDEALDKLAPLRRSAELGTRITALRTLIGTVAYDATQLVPLLKYCVAHKAEQTAWHEALWSTLTSDVPLCVWAGQLRQNEEAWPLLSALLEHTLRAIDVAFGTLESVQGFLTRRIAPVKPDVVAPLLLRLMTCDERLIEALRRQLGEMPTYTVPLSTTSASSGVVAADLFSYLRSTLTTWTERLLSASASTTPASPPSSQQRLFALLDGLTASLARAVKARRKRHAAQAQSTSHSATHTESSNCSAEEKALDAAKALYLDCVNRFIAQAHDDAKGGSNDSETLRRMAEMALHAMTFLFRCWPQATRRTLLPRLLSSEDEEEGTAAKGHGSVSCGWVGMAEVRQVIERDMQGRWLDRCLGLWSCATLSCVPTAATTNPTRLPSSMPQRVSNAACSAFFAALRDRARADLADRRAKSALSTRTAQHLFTSLQTRYVPFSCHWARRWTAGQQRRYSHTLVHLLQLSQGVKSEEVDAANEGTSEPSVASEAASTTTTTTTSSDGAEPSLPSSQGLSLEQQRSLLRCLVRMPATVAEKDGLCALARNATDASASLVRDLALRLLGRRDDDVTAVRELLRALTDDRASQALFALRRVVRCDGLRRYGIALERDVVQAVLAHHKVGLSKELVRLLATLEESAEAYACLRKYFIAPAVAQFVGTGVTTITTTTEPTIRDESRVAEQTHQPNSGVAASAACTTPNEAENVPKSPSSSGLHRDVLLALLTAVQQHQLGRPEVWQLYESVAQRPRSPVMTQTSEEEEDRRVEACKVISNVPDAVLQQEWQRRRYYGGVLLQILQTYLPHTSKDATAAQSSQRQTPLLIAVLQRLNRRDTPLPTDLEKAMQDTLLNALVTVSTHYTNDDCYLVQCMVEVLLGLKCLPAVSLATHLTATQSDRMLQDMMKSVSDAAQYGNHSGTMMRRIRRVACSLVDTLVERRRQPTLAVQLLLQCLPCEQWTAKLQLLLDAKLMHKGACSEAVRCAEEVCEQEQNRTKEDEEPATAKLEKEVLRQHSEPVLRRIGLAILVCIGNERGWSNSRRAALTAYQRDTDRWVSDDAMLVSVNDE